MNSCKMSCLCQYLTRFVLHVCDSYIFSLHTMLLKPCLIFLVS